MDEEEKTTVPVEEKTTAPVEEEKSTAPVEEDMDAKYHVQVINLLQELCDLVKASAKVDEVVEEVAEDEEDASAFDELLD